MKISDIFTFVFLVMKERVIEGNLQSTGKHKIMPNLRKSNS